MKIIAVNFYQQGSGKEPVREWLKSLNVDDCRIIGTDIKTVEYGWPLGMPLVRKMDDNLWEVRSSITGNKIARVLFTVAGDRLILLHGFIKKSQATPANDLKLTKKRRDEVLS